MAAVEGGTHNFNSISIGGRGGVSQGRLTISPTGFLWRKANGGNAIEIKKEDIAALTWTPIGPRGCQLGVQTRPSTAGAAAGASSAGGAPPSGSAGANFLGFREQDLESLRTYCSGVLGVPLAQREMATAGRNWGEIELRGGSLAFLADASGPAGAAASGGDNKKVAFELPLADVAQAQNAKDEVALEFHVDDTAAGDREDVLVEAVFVVPPGNKAWAPPPAADGKTGAGADADGEDKPAPPRPAKVLLDALLPLTDAVGAGAGGQGDEPIATFEGVAVLQPRGRFDIEFYPSYLRLVGQTQEFKIRYASVPRVAVLPRPSSPHTLVVLGLDPPIRKGQTFYSFLVAQFPSADATTVRLAEHFTDEAIAAKNDKCNQALGKGNILQREHSGAAPDVFARLLRGLAAARLSRPSPKDGFRDARKEGFAVRCSYKADDGYLYPLTGAFFFVHKPPLQMPYEDVDGVEFARQQAGAGGAARTFDLVVRMRGGQEHQFRGIQRTEWQGLFDWIQGRGIHIENVDSARRGPGGGAAAAAGAFALGDDDEDGLGGGAGGGANGEEDESEDSDFEGGSGSGSDSDSDSDEDGSGSSGGGSSDDAEMVSEEGVPLKPKKGGKKGGGKKAAASSGGSSGDGSDEEGAAKKKKKKRRAGSDDGELPSPAGGGGGKKKRAKKDPNAPKKALSAFMYFSNAKRDEVKGANPGIAFTEVGRALGERWREATAEEKREFEEMAERDKERYAREMKAWKAGGSGAGGGGGAASGDEETEGAAAAGEKKEAAAASEEEEDKGGDGEGAAAAAGGDE